MLKAAQSELAKALDEACAHEDVQEESTAELIRLEESLSDAAQAAKQAVSLRRKLGSERAPIADRRVAPPAPALDISGAVREFTDANGTLWRVWAVKPGQAHPDRPVENRLGEYSAGWLAFETADETQRRRLPHHPADWAARTDEDLALLLDAAEPVRPRKKSSESANSDTEDASA
jgi:hypothetical protein